MRPGQTTAWLDPTLPVSEAGLCADAPAFLEMVVPGRVASFDTGVGLGALGLVCTVCSPILRGPHPGLSASGGVSLCVLEKPGCWGTFSPTSLGSPQTQVSGPAAGE